VREWDARIKIRKSGLSSQTDQGKTKAEDEIYYEHLENEASLPSLA
jgi:hypothetical protein